MSDPVKHPVWFVPIAKDVRKLYKLPGAIERFGAMAKQYRDEHDSQQAAQDKWTKQFHQYFAKKIAGIVKRKRGDYLPKTLTSSCKRLQDQSAGPPHKGWHFTSCRLNGPKGSMLLGGWCPPRFNSESRPRVHSITSFCGCSGWPNPEFDPDRVLTLPEVYVICIAIHDIVYRGIKKIHTPANNSGKELSAFFEWMRWSHTCDSIAALHEDDRHIIEAFLEDVKSDLETTLTEKPTGGNGGKQILAPNSESILKDSSGYLVAEVCDMAGLSGGMVNKYAKAAGILTPSRGKRNHKYTAEQVEMILQTTINMTSSLSVRAHCQKSLNNLKEITK